MAITRITSPAITSVASTAISGTLPAANINDTSISNITALPAGVGGKVLQVVQGTSTTATDSSTESFVATNLTASITPSSSSNKILIIASGCYDLNGNARQADFAVYRNTTISFKSWFYLRKY